MLSVLLSSTLLLGCALAGITDLNCTELSSGSPKYAPSAVNCKNKLPDATCLVLYTTAVKVNDDTDRDAKCGGDPVDPHLVRAAVEHCPQTCGYCCLTPAFACDDKLRFDISGDCVDEVPDCKINGRMICQSKSLGAFAKRYCKKTCGYCKDSTRIAAEGWKSTDMGVGNMERHRTRFSRPCSRDCIPSEFTLNRWCGKSTRRRNFDKY